MSARVTEPCLSGRPVTIPHAKKERTVAMAAATITTATIAISIITMPVPMITAPGAFAVAGGDTDDDGGEQHRQVVYERANASRRPMS